MSLDVYLRIPGQTQRLESRIFVRDDGQTKELSRKEWNERFPGREPVVVEETESDEVFHANITHNLGTMAVWADLYEWLWRPDEVGVAKAQELIEPLRRGLDALVADPDKFKQYNPENGWGNYEGLVDFVKRCLEACEENPEAKVEVSR